MSEPIPEAIPTSADPKSRRPVKRLRGANTLLAEQANEIENLMWDPDRPVEIPKLSSESKPKLAAPPEIVANVQGSSAGAGSGEFHVYKASRRRENERLRAMDEEADKEVDDAEWQQKLEEKRRQDDEKTAKKRAQRNKRKGKQGKKEGTPTVDDPAEASATKGGAVRNPLQVPKKDTEPTDILDQDPQAGKHAPENGITIHDEG